MIGMCLCQSQGKGKLSHTVFAGDGDVLFQISQNGFYNVQTKAHALPVHGAGIVRLVEPVENQGELVGGNGGTQVFNGGNGLPVLFDDLNGDRGAGSGKFGRVVSRL